MTSTTRFATAVAGSGPVALAHALFAARWGPVVLAGREPDCAPNVERVPAPLLTLLIEVGVTPGELDVHELTTKRIAAWESHEPTERQGPSCAHLDRGALAQALVRRIRECPEIHLAPPLTGPLPQATSGRFLGPGWEADRLVDATGRRALTARGRIRPVPAWVATCSTVPRGDLDPALELSAGPTGYAYRLGSGRWLTVGWVGPGPAPRDGDALRTRIVEEGAGWLCESVGVGHGCLSRRVASLAVSVRDPHVVAIGDTALARDALASQGTSLGLSDARLAATPPAGTDALIGDLERRHVDGLERHLRSLAGLLATCRHRSTPAWNTYARWLERTLALTGGAPTARLG